VSRLDHGGRIDRSQPVSFSFDGSQRLGFAGDTLASALLASGERVFGRSIYHDRPRGIVAAGRDEPCAYVQLGEAGQSEPMQQATRVEIVEGLVAAPLAGIGSLAAEADPDRYDKVHAHCDVLVVGGGPAGIAAAWAAGRTGARTLLLEDDFALGGQLLGVATETPGAAGRTWLDEKLAEIATFRETRVHTRTIVSGLYDGGSVYALETRIRPGETGAPGVSVRRLWQIRARQLVLATGALERPVAFSGNDLPGVMLAGAARTYLNRFGVRCGEQAVVFTTNDSAYSAALELHQAGCTIKAIVDTRDDPRSVFVSRAREAGIAVRSGSAVAAAHGSDGIEAVTVGRLLSESTVGEELDVLGCDRLFVSGGWDPQTQLLRQVGARVVAHGASSGFGIETPPSASTLAGACNGTFLLGTTLIEGTAAGERAALAAGFRAEPVVLPDVAEPLEEAPRPVFFVAPADGDLSSCYVDLHRDSTVDDVQRAVGAGLTSIEHVKRYTSAGTGAEQGRTATVNVAAVTAELIGAPLTEVGLQSARPPTIPLAFGSMAGRHRGDLYEPVRVTPIHSWHVEQGAVFEDVGQWKRPWYYPLGDEDLDAAVLRECAAVRASVGMVDASTLGKIDVRGPDSVEFLNRLYTNAYDNLAVGACRYGLMCTLDGMLFDDGVVMRIGEEHFVATTTTGGAAGVLDWMEEWLQTEWPDLDVYLTSVTEQWATIAVVGPASRDVLGRLTEIPLDNESFPFMGMRDGVVAGVPARVCRISFSGELAFEVNVEGLSARAVWDAIWQAGQPEGITPYGTETLHVLRAEKGYVIVGQETDGTVTPVDLGMDWIISKKKSQQFVGKRSLRREDTARPDRKQLVGLLPHDHKARLPEGAQLVLDQSEPVPMRMVGHVTSSYDSVALGRTFALALLESGSDRMGDTVYAPLEGRVIAAEVTGPVLFDPENERRDG
jgi:sarcosine oxidase subunit alpha